MAKDKGPGTKEQGNSAVKWKSILGNSEKKKLQKKKEEVQNRQNPLLVSAELIPALENVDDGSSQTPDFLGEALAASTPYMAPA